MAKSSSIDEIMAIAKQCGSLKFEGTEKERQELFELKMQLDSWQKMCENLLSGKNWAFPCVERMLNASEYKLREWRRRLCGLERDVHKELLMYTVDQRLAANEVTFAKPNQETVDRVVEVLVGLRKIWAVVCIKFAQAIVDKISDIEERKKRCRGIVHFS
ncbi:uncharacterized protein LOC131671712 [Phymastichus coffea]|uniref:uncharacterized protein LOC131671712 n=1 Tax=Phymastichus coffea TaxID=108790 RepID=UPI00273A9C27|nr:uncharacterized protein LOC131671712 [Phymastichus coffea]XP_058804329.1 uncharacterized protein LOC131671712 [Phymastichus coffea]